MARDLGQMRVESTPFVQLNQFFPGGGGKQLFANGRGRSATESAYSNKQTGTHWSSRTPPSRGERELQSDEWDASSWRFDGGSLQPERVSRAAEADSFRNHSGAQNGRNGKGADLGLQLESRTVGDNREANQEVLEIDEDETELPRRTFVGRHTPSPPSNEPNPCSGGDESPEEDSSLILKLGGTSYACVEDTRAGKRGRSSSPQAQVPACQVDGCTADLSRAKDYHRRHKVCGTHSKSTSAVVSRVMQRFCQQCSRFHPLEQFDEGKRSCRRRLAGHNKRRRKTQPDAASGRVEDQSGVKNADLITLLGVLNQLKGPLERASAAASEQDLLLQCLRQAGNLPTSALEGLTRSAPLWSHLTRTPDLGVPQIDPNLLASQLSGHLPVSLQPQDAITMLLQNNLKQAALLAQGNMLHRAGLNGNVSGVPLPYPSSHPETSDSHAVPQGSSLASSLRIPGGIDPAQLLASLALSMQQSIATPAAGQGNTVSANGFGRAPASVQRVVPDLPPTDTRNFLDQRLDRNEEDDSSGPRAVGRQQQPFERGVSQSHQRSLLESQLAQGTMQRPSIDLQRPPSDQDSDAHESGSGSGSGLGSGPGSGQQSPGTPPTDWENNRISFKLFDKHPGQFPEGLRSRIDEWLSHRPSDMEGFIRPGCIILTLFVSMPSPAWAELISDFSGSVKRLLSLGCTEFWCTGRLLVQVGRHSVFVVDGEIVECRTSTLFGSPYLLSVRPLAVVAGEESRLAVYGLNLPNRLLCAFKGKYSSGQADERSDVEDESVASVDETGVVDDTEGTANSLVQQSVTCEDGEKDSLNSGVVESSPAVAGPQSDSPSFVSTVSAVHEEGDYSSPDSESCEHDDLSESWDAGVTEPYVGHNGAGDVRRSLVRTRAVFSFDGTTFPSPVAGGGFGRCFIEVDQDSLEGNWRPVIVADGAVSAEICTLENEIERAAWVAGRVAEDHGLDASVVLYCSELARLAEEEDVTRFLHELGWFFQRSYFRSLSSSRATPVPSTRFKQLLVYSVERNWCAVVGRVLDIAFDGEDWEEIFSELSDMCDEGASLLHRAVRNKNRPMVELLLGYAPSFLAGISDPDVESFKRKLAFKVRWGAMFKPDMRGAGGLTPLHIAASLQDGEEVVDALTSGPCQMGLHAWLHARDDFGDTPLSLALAGENVKSVQVVRAKLTRLLTPGSTVIDVAPGWDEHLKGISPVQLALPVWGTPSRFDIDDSRALESPVCREQDFARLPRDVCGVKGAIYRPFLVSIMGIACICVCVGLLLRGPQNILKGFTWSELDQGPA